MQLPISYLKASDGSGNASVATIQNVRSGGASTIVVDTVQGIPTNFIATMGTPHTFNDPITGEEITIISEATAVDFAGHVDGSDLEIDEIAPGYTDNGSEVGDIIIIRPTTLWGDNVAQALTPTGMVAPFAGSSAPAHWLICDGSAVSRETYENLFAIIGETYGEGDGSTTFNLPDMRSRTPQGVGTGTWSFEFASTDVDTGDDEITVPASDNLKTGRKIQLTTTDTLPTGLSLATDYYIIVVDSTTIKLATSAENAIKGTAIDITGQGSGTNTATGTLSARTLGEVGGAEEHHHGLSNTLAGVPFALTSSQTRVKVDGPSSGITSSNDQAGMSWGSGGSSIGGSLGLVGNTNPNTGLPPFLGLNYIIKT